MATNARIKILIVDDHALVRLGLRALFEKLDGFEVVADAHDGHMALTLCDYYHPDVVLMDLLMSGISGIETTRQIYEKHPEIKIIILSSENDGKHIQDALRAGAASYLLKNDSVDDVAEAIRKTHHGQSMLSAQVISSLIAVSQEAPKHDYGLSPRQREVLALMIRGLNNPEIAEELIISQSTVKNHLMAIFEKLGVRDRRRAVVVALQNHVLED